MTDARDVIKKVKRIPKLNIRDTSMDWLTDIKADHYMQEFWESDKRIKHGHNFEAMLRGKEVHNAAKEAEAHRQEEINKQRMVNLKKARRALKKKRSTT